MDMETGWAILISVLIVAVVGLLWYLLSLRNSVREVAEELEEKLQLDTNTLISISSGDRTVRMLAARINTQLHGLRRERLRLQNGDAELKSAIMNMSHDLRTPLTAISGYLDLLEQEEHTDNSKRYLAVIRERTDTMRTLTEELFQYSVITSTSENLNQKPVILNDILEQSLVGLYGVFSGRGITPDIRMPEEQVVGLADENALRRVFDNILNNATKYSDGDLTVALDTSGTVLFSNEAVALSCVETERLFDRFFTVETVGGGSTGLGLSIARLLTEKMGGSITAEYKNKKLLVRVSLKKNI